MVDYPEYTDQHGTRWAICMRPGECRLHSEHAPVDRWLSWPVTGPRDVEILLAYYCIGEPERYAALAAELWERSLEKNLT